MQIHEQGIKTRSHHADAQTVVFILNTLLQTVSIATFMRQRQILPCRPSCSCP